MFRRSSHSLIAALVLVAACGKGEPTKSTGSASGTGSATESEPHKSPHDRLVDQVLLLQSSADEAKKALDAARARGASPDELSNLDMQEQAVESALRKATAQLKAEEMAKEHGTAP